MFYFVKLNIGRNLVRISCMKENNMECIIDFLINKRYYIFSDYNLCYFFGKFEWILNIYFV